MNNREELRSSKVEMCKYVGFLELNTCDSIVINPSILYYSIQGLYQKYTLEGYSLKSVYSDRTRYLMDELLDSLKASITGEIDIKSIYKMFIETVDSMKLDEEAYKDNQDLEDEQR